MPAGCGTDGFELIDRPDRTASHVVGVFQGDEPTAREMRGIRSNDRLELIGLKQAAMTSNRSDHRTRMEGRSTPLKMNGVGTLLHHDFVAGASVNFKGNFI